MDGFEERVRALFEDPDRARSVYRDGVQYVEVAYAHLHEAMGEQVPSVEDERVVHLAATLGSAIEQHIVSTEARFDRASPQEQQGLAEQLRLLRKAAAYRDTRAAG